MNDTNSKLHDALCGPYSRLRTNTEELKRLLRECDKVSSYRTGCQKNGCTVTYIARVTVDDQSFSQSISVDKVQTAMCRFDLNLEGDALYSAACAALLGGE